MQWTLNTTNVDKAKASLEAAGGGLGVGAPPQGFPHTCWEMVAAAQGVCRSQGWGWWAEDSNQRKAHMLPGKQTPGPLAGAGGVAAEPPELTGNL